MSIFEYTLLSRTSIRAGRRRDFISGAYTVINYYMIQTNINSCSLSIKYFWENVHNRVTFEAKGIYESKEQCCLVLLKVINQRQFRWSATASEPSVSILSIILKNVHWPCTSHRAHVDNPWPPYVEERKVMVSTQCRKSRLAPVYYRDALK